MHLGIFAKTFPRPTLEETLDAVAGHGLTHVQFNMSCVGLPTLPERIDEELVSWIARSLRERGLTMAAISGTFNLCDPDRLAACKTTCGGSRCWPRLPLAGYPDHHALHGHARSGGHVEMASRKRRGGAPGRRWSSRCGEAVRDRRPP